MSNRVTFPDFDLLQELADEIANYTAEDILLEARYDFTKSNEIKEGLNDPTPKGKSPSVSYVTSLVDSSETLLNIKKEIAENKKKLKRSELKFKILLMQADLYRTESANQRNAIS